MKYRWKAILAAFISASIVMLAGVFLFFDPIAKMDSTAGPLVPPAVNFFVYMILSIWLFAWVARQTRNASLFLFSRKRRVSILGFFIYISGYWTPH